MIFLALGLYKLYFLKMGQGCERAKVPQLLSCCWNVSVMGCVGTQGVGGQCKCDPGGCNSHPRLAHPTSSARRKSSEQEAPLIPETCPGCSLLPPRDCEITPQTGWCSPAGLGAGWLLCIALWVYVAGQQGCDPWAAPGAGFLSFFIRSFLK